MNTTTNLLPALAAFTLFTGSLFGQILVTPINPPSINPTPRPITPNRTPHQIALHRWFEASPVLDVAVPGARRAAFDGENLWVIGSTLHAVTRIRPHDGASTAITFTGIPTGMYGLPMSLQYDGMNLWIATANNTLFRHRISTGETATPIALPGMPSLGGITFDGESVFVALSNQMAARINARTGTLSGTIPIPPGTSSLLFDGQSIWAAVSPVNIVAKIRPSDGAILGTYQVTNPTAMAFDGQTVWITSGSANMVNRLRTSDGVVIASYPTGAAPSGIAFDGHAMWVANSGAASATKIRVADGVTLGTFPTSTGPAAVTFDGTSVWVVNQTAGTVTKM